MNMFSCGARVLLFSVALSVAPAPLLAQDASSKALRIAAECAAFYEGYVEAGSVLGIPLDRNLEASRQAVETLAELSGTTSKNGFPFSDRGRALGAKAAKSRDVNGLNAVLTMCTEIDRIATEAVRLGPAVGMKTLRCYGIFDALAKYATGTHRDKAIMRAVDLRTIAAVLQAEFGKGQKFDSADFEATLKEGRATGRRLATADTPQPQALDECIALHELGNSLISLVYAVSPK